MSNLITISPFLSFGVVAIGIHYGFLYLVLLGVIFIILSFFALLCKCGSDMRDEVKRANRQDN